MRFSQFSFERNVFNRMMEVVYWLRQIAISIIIHAHNYEIMSSFSIRNSLLRLYRHLKVIEATALYFVELRLLI